MKLRRTLFLFSLFATTLFATLAAAAPRVAVLAASTTGSDVQSKLQGTNAFSLVDLINVSLQTPTVGQLQAYDAVVVYSNTSFLSPSTLGDNLATYLEGGGGVVLFDWEAEESGFAALGGRYQATYTLMTSQPSFQVSTTAVNLGAVVEQGSALMKGVTTFGCAKAPCHHLTSAVKNGGAVVVKWSDGNPLLIRGNVNGHTVVEINSFGASTSVVGGEWDPTTSGALLIRNALLYTIPGVVRPNKPSLSFTDTPVGQSVTQTLTYTNTGMAAVSFDAVSIGGANAADFAALPSATLPRTIAAGASFDVVVAFTPSATGARSGIVQASFGGAFLTTDVQTFGNGLPAGIGVMPPLVSFGGTGVGNTVKQTFTVTNNGNASVVLSAASVSQNSAEFTATPIFALPVTLPAGASFDFNATFTPGGSGVHFGTVTISVANGQPITVPLTGSAGTAVIALGNNGVIFGNTHVGSSSPPQTLTVGNTGYADLHVTSASLTGANAADFSLMLPNFPATVSPGQSLSYGIVFRPMAAGARSATVTLTSDDPNMGTLSFTVGGQGVSYAESVAPGMLDFGMVKAGTTATAQQATLTNTSKAPLVVKKVLITGPQAAAFSLVNPPADNSAIAPGASLSASVAFKPATAALATATLTFLLDDPNMPAATVSLRGQGTAGALALAPVSIEFGGVPFGKSSAAKVVTLTNTGTAPLQISALIFGGNDPTAFGSPDSPMLPVTIAPGSNIMFDVVYTPSIHGMQGGTLVVTSDDPLSPMASIQLHGNGTQAKLAVSPMNIDFGVTVVGSPTEAVPVTLTNTGDQTLPISTIQIQGAGASAFKLDTNPAPLTLDPGTSVTLNLRFAPTMAALANAQLVVTPSDANLVPATVALKGTAVSMAISLTPMTVDFGTVQIGSKSDPVTVTIKNTSGASITLVPLKSTNPAFTVDTSATTLNLAAGASTTLSVVFTPATTSIVMGQADLALSTAPAHVIASLTFAGEGTMPMMMGGGTHGGTSSSCSAGHRGLPTSSAPLALLLGALLLSRRRRAA